MMYGLGWGGDWFGHTLFGDFFMIIVWVAIILFVVWLVHEVAGTNKRGDGREHHGNPSSRAELTTGHRTALDILNERYAKGEIDRKEFEEKKKDLGH